MFHPYLLRRLVDIFKFDKSFYIQDGTNTSLAYLSGVSIKVKKSNRIDGRKQIVVKRLLV